MTRPLLASALTAALAAAPAAAQETAAPSEPLVAPEPAPGPVRAALLGFSSDDMTPRQRVLFERALASEIGKLEGVTLVEVNEPNAEREAASCPEEKPSCLARFAEALGADVVVTGRAVALGPRQRVLTLKRLRIRDAVIEGTTTQRISGEGDTYMLVLGQAVRELFAPATLRSDALEGVPLAVAARWSPPPVHQAIFWVEVTCTVGALATSAAFFGLSQADANQYRDLATQSVTTPVAGSELVRLGERVNERRTYAGIALGAGLAVGIATVVSAFFTDWSSDEKALLLLPTPGGAVAGYSQTLP